MYSETEVAEMQAELSPEVDLPEEDVEAPPEAEASPTEEPSADEVAAPAADLPAVPSTWRKAAAEQWATLPEAIRDEVLKREQDMHNGLQQYSERAQLADRYQQAISPMASLYQQHNVDPLTIIPSLLEAHAQLTLGSQEQRAALLYDLADQYGVNLGQATPQRATETALQQRLAQLEQRYEQEYAARQQEQQAQFTYEAESFLADPNNLYAADLVEDIAQLLQQGQATTLQDAYEKAMYLNPNVRQRVIAAEAAKIAEQQRAAAAAAQQRLAGRPLRSSVASATSQSTGNLSEDLSSLYDSLSNSVRG